MNAWNSLMFTDFCVFFFFMFSMSPDKKSSCVACMFQPITCTSEMSSWSTPRSSSGPTFPSEEGIGTPCSFKSPVNRPPCFCPLFKSPRFHPRRNQYAMQFRAWHVSCIINVTWIPNELLRNYFFVGLCNTLAERVAILYPDAQFCPSYLKFPYFSMLYLILQRLLCQVACPCRQCFRPFDPATMSPSASTLI